MPNVPHGTETQVIYNGQFNKMIAEWNINLDNSITMTERDFK